MPGADPPTLMLELSRAAHAERPYLALCKESATLEQVFLAASEDERAAFVADLVALVRAPSPPHRVVLTVRSDFESFVAKHPALYERYAAGIDTPTLRMLFAQAARSTPLVTLIGHAAIARGRVG